MIKQFYKFCTSSLKARGLIYQQTYDKIPRITNRINNPIVNIPNLEISEYHQYKLSAYCGFDPTAPSLHLGNLLAILMLVRIQELGYQPIALIGGATGLIGDPSGKSSERILQSRETIENNAEAIKLQIQQVLRNTQSQKALFLNNIDFYNDMNCLEFLRDVGKNFRINTLLSRETIQTRLDSEEGLSYTEFSYSLLQAYDFARLFEQYNCVLQIGGSDQWGNITGGCDFIRRKFGKHVFGLTTPLLVDKRGKKFGKSEGNAYYLDETMTSREEMGQYLLNQPDDMIEDLLLKLTFLTQEEIQEIIKQHFSQPEKRIAQKRLNQELQAIIYGEFKKGSNEILHSIKWNEINQYTPEQIEQLINGISRLKISSEKFKQLTLIELLVETQSVSSKSEGKRLIEMGGISILNKKTNSQQFKEISLDNLINGKYLNLRVGKKEIKLIEIV